MKHNLKEIMVLYTVIYAFRFVSHRCLHFFGSFFLSDEFVGSACAVIR